MHEEILVHSGWSYQIEACFTLKFVSQDLVKEDANLLDSPISLAI